MSLKISFSSFEEFLIFHIITDLKPDSFFSKIQDPYITRSLPYVIGTPAFMQDDDVGLVEMPSGTHHLLNLFLPSMPTKNLRVLVLSEFELTTIVCMYSQF